MQSSEPGQHRFTKGNSCLPNLIPFCSKVTCPVDEGNVVDAFFLYFSKAFDTVLPEKNYSVGSRCACLMKWLKGRAWRVVVNGTTGPSGSILEPVLFSMNLSLICMQELNTPLGSLIPTIIKVGGVVWDKMPCRGLCVVNLTPGNFRNRREGRTILSANAVG